MSGVMVHLDVDEVLDLGDDILRNTAILEAKAMFIVQDAGYETVAAAQALAPVDTGHLKASIGVDFGDNLLSFEAGPTAEYGAYVEEGTAPHIINAHGGALRFEIDGHVVFARSVLNPGHAPQPYMAPAFDGVYPSVVDLLAELGIHVVDPA